MLENIFYIFDPNYKQYIFPLFIVLVAYILTLLIRTYFAKKTK